MAPVSGRRYTAVPSGTGHSCSVVKMTARAPRGPDPRGAVHRIARMVPDDQHISPRRHCRPRQGGKPGIPYHQDEPPAAFPRQHPAPVLMDSRGQRHGKIFQNKFISRANPPFPNGTFRIRCAPVPDSGIFLRQRFHSGALRPAVPGSQHAGRPDTTRLQYGKKGVPDRIFRSCGHDQRGIGDDRGPGVLLQRNDDRFIFPGRRCGRKIAARQGSHSPGLPPA